MADCPKCGKHLRLIDWKQHCPHCGANIVIYDLQERLMQQADEAEVQHYHFQKKVDRVKGAFIGSPLAITRIFTSLLPAGPLFLPICSATFSEPFEAATENVNFMTIYKGISSVGDILGLFSSGNKANILFTLSFIMLLLSVLITFVHFVCNALACSPKGKQRNIIIDVLIAATSVAAVVIFALMGEGGAVSGTLGLGAYLYLAAQAINITIDLITLTKGIEIKHAQCYVGGIPIEEYFEMLENGASKEEIREEQYKRLQAIQDEKEAQLKAQEEAENAAKEGPDV